MAGYHNPLSLSAFHFYFFFFFFNFFKNHISFLPFNIISQKKMSFRWFDEEKMSFFQQQQK